MTSLMIHSAGVFCCYYCRKCLPGLGSNFGLSTYLDQSLGRCTLRNAELWNAEFWKGVFCGISAAECSTNYTLEFFGILHWRIPHSAKFK